ncbi:DUF89 domain-containing protein [candidate division KSB1 bacterium]
MKSDLQCLVCLLKQALNTVKLVTDDEIHQREVCNKVSRWIIEADLEKNPAEVSTVIYRIVSDVTGVKDPYKEIKEKTNRQALLMLPEMQNILSQSENPLDTALHIAVAGNIIDLGIGQKFDLKKDVREILDTPFAVNDIEHFRNELKPGRKLLFLGDNSGEIVFDRILVEHLLSYDIDIVYAVKSGPIINDAMPEDAETAGITGLVPVIETGSDDIGINFKNTSKEFNKEFQDADLILGKGHGNFETLSGSPQNIYFLLKAKCGVVAREAGVEKGDIVFKKNLKP